MTRQLQESDRFETRGNLVLEEIDDEVVILDLQENVYFGLNEVAKLVWRGLEEGQTLGEVVDTLVEHFEVEREVVEGDVRSFVDDALAKELISPVAD